MAGVLNAARWRRLMGEWGAPENEAVFADLDAAYSESHRHYHTGQHIADCLEQLDGARDLAAAPVEVELALWFHDAVYRPTSSSNELKSAEILESLLATPAIYRTARFRETFEVTARRNLLRAIEALR